MLGRIDLNHESCCGFQPETMMSDRGDDSASAEFLQREHQIAVAAV